MKTFWCVLLLLVSCSTAFASTVVIFDDSDPIVPGRVIDRNDLANTPDFEGRTDVLINPDLSAVAGVSQRYWKKENGTIVPMTQDERNALDANALTQMTSFLRDDSKALFSSRSDLGMIFRAFADVLKDEINILRANDGLPDRTLNQLKTAIRNRIDSGTVDQ